MSEREEFEEWYKSTPGSYVGDYTCGYSWAAWKAARASRWQSMESAPDGKNVRGWFGRYGARECICNDGTWHDSDGSCFEFVTPLAWHPLPDPPTKKELEKLK